MITVLTKQFKVTCDRCGKEELCDDYTKSSVDYGEVRFATETKTLKMGGVCKECYKAFCEIAENFFDEVNTHG